MSATIQSPGNPVQITSSKSTGVEEAHTPNSSHSVNLNEKHSDRTSTTWNTEEVMTPPPRSIRSTKQTHITATRRRSSISYMAKSRGTAALPFPLNMATVSRSSMNNTDATSSRSSLAGLSYTPRLLNDKGKSRSIGAFRLTRQKTDPSINPDGISIVQSDSSAFEDVPLVKKAVTTTRPRGISAMLSMDALPGMLKAVTEASVQSMDVESSRHTPCHHLSAGRVPGTVADIKLEGDSLGYRANGHAHIHFPFGFTVNTCVSGAVYVSNVWLNWPSHRAGLRFGDQILKIGNVRVHGMPPNEVYKILSSADLHTLRIQSHPHEHTITLERRVIEETGALEILGITFLRGNILKTLPNTAVARSGFSFVDHFIVAVNDEVVLGLPDKYIMRRFKNTGAVVSVTVIHQEKFFEIIGTKSTSIDLLRRSALVDLMVRRCRRLTPGGLSYFLRASDSPNAYEAVEGTPCLMPNEKRSTGENIVIGSSSHHETIVPPTTNILPMSTSLSTPTTSTTPMSKIHAHSVEFERGSPTSLGPSHNLSSFSTTHVAFHNPVEHTSSGEIITGTQEQTTTHIPAYNGSIGVSVSGNVREGKFASSLDMRSPVQRIKLKQSQQPTEQCSQTAYTTQYVREQHCQRRLLQRNSSSLSSKGYHEV
eukprot:CFRG7282T1